MTSSRVVEAEKRRVPQAIGSQRTPATPADSPALAPAPLAELDENRESLPEGHDDLLEEIAAFARRGWAYSFDAETGGGYDAHEYDVVLEQILWPAGVRRVRFDDETCIVRVDGRIFQAQPPDQDGDWLDVAWIAKVANLALADSRWQLVIIADADLHQVIFGVVPLDVWTAVTDRHLTGAWRTIAPVEPIYN